jgi:hypothetical protein
MRKPAREINVSNKEGHTLWVLQEEPALDFEVTWVPDVVRIQKRYEVALSLLA